jgi:hypothetical protein
MFTLTLLSIPWWVSIHRICTIPGWLRTWQQQKGKKKEARKIQRHENSHNQKQSAKKSVTRHLKNGSGR